MKIHILHRQRSRAGFSLVELVVSSAVLLVIGAIIVSVLDVTSKVSLRATTQMDANATARRCLDMIARDLQGMPVPYDLTSDDSLQLLVNPPGTTVPSDLQNPHSIFLQTAINRSTDFGNLALVGYFVLRDIDLAAPQNTRLQLRRLYLEPEDPKIASDYRIYTNPDGWLTSTFLRQFAPINPTDDFDNGQRGWVADGVLGLWIRCLDREGNPITQDGLGNAFSSYVYDSRRGYSSSGAFSYSGNAWPPSIEVALVCCAAQDMKLIQNLPTPAPTNPTNFEADVATFVDTARQMNPNVKSIHSYSRVFHLPSAIE